VYAMLLAFRGMEVDESWLAYRGSLSAHINYKHKSAISV